MRHSLALFHCLVKSVKPKPKTHIRKMAQLLPDFAPGPLDYYRKKASFDWKKLKIFLETEDVVEYQVR